MRPIASALCLLLLASTTAHATSRTVRARRAAAARMAAIPAGSYRPLYRPLAGAPGDGRLRVAAFRIDRQAVTRGEFLAFVRDNPAWRRSAVRPPFAERAYLGDWRADLDAGDAISLARPVTAVSWFAARAYCAARGKRLPTVDEWEYVAAASETDRDAARDPRFVRRLLALYARRAPADALPHAGAGFRNAYGVGGLHDLVWEWTSDFDGEPATGHAHEAARGSAPHDHRLFCASASVGAADPSDYPAFMRYGFRAGLTGRTTLGTLGFRCAAA